MVTLPRRPEQYRAPVPGSRTSLGDRPPQARVLRNDNLMLDGALTLLAERGWAGMTLAAVARTMGKSGQPVRSRVRTRSELAALVWERRAGRHLAEALTTCIGGLRQARSAGATDPLVSAWLAMLQRPTELDAAAELLIMSLFDPIIAEAIERGLAPEVQQWTRPSQDITPEDAARAAYVISLALGLLVLSRHERAATEGMAEALTTRVRALQADAVAAVMPDATATHLLDYPDLAPGDPALDILLNRTLELVAEHGFDGVAVAEIARAAGFTEGLIYSRYPSKLDLFTDALRRQGEAGLQVNHAFTESLRADHGLGMAEAVLIREYQLPAHAVPRAMALEQVRLMWRYPELMQTANAEVDAFRRTLMQDPSWGFESEADFFLNYAISLGVATLPSLDPEAYQLPHHVVMVPLFDLLQAQPHLTRPDTPA